MDTKKISKSHEDFIGVDLHVHTPASKCYKGNKADEEYIEILKRYIEKNIKLVAITDHNSIKGYIKLIELKNAMAEKIKVLAPYVDQYPALRKELDALETTYQLFDKICILPGVEFEATPGIHLLFIFDPSGDINKVNQFLIDAGYTSEYQGSEAPDEPSNLDVLKAITDAANLGAIVVAAHADSNNGIYNDLKPGNYRAQVFKESHLMGISYKSANSREKMESWFLQEEYKRREPVAFIQCSDYHGGEDDPGSCITYLKLQSINFSGVYTALKNPNQCVSATVRPEIADIINKITQDSNTVAFEKLDEMNIDEVKKASCAILNNGFGTVIFGVKPESKTIIGINHQAIFKSLVEEALDAITPSFPAFVYDLTQYDYGNKIVLCVRLKSTMESIYCLKSDRSYVINSKKDVVEASLNELVAIAGQNLLNRISAFQMIYDEKISGVLMDLELLRQSSQQFKLVHQIECCSLKLKDVVDIETIGYYKDEISLTNFPPNGDPDGNVFIVDRNDPRLPYAYLRYSIPRYNKFNINQLSIKKHSGTAIVMIPGGAVYCVKTTDQEWGLITLDTTEPTLLMKVKPKFQNYFSECALVAWLKSSLFLWYCYIAHGQLNPHDPKYVLDIPIPNISLLKKDSVLDKAVTSIIDLELAFLGELVKIIKKPWDDKKAGICLVEEHNTRIGTFAYEIDCLFNKEFVLTEETLEAIRNCFEIKGLFYMREEENSIFSSKEEAAATTSAS